MAIQILPNTGLGERLGNAVGTGLGAGLQGLLQNKLTEIEKQKGINKNATGLKALGLPAELAQLPENLQGIISKQLLQQPSQEAYANALSSLFGDGMQPPNLSGLNARQASDLARLGLQKQKSENQQQQFNTKEERVEQHHIDKETKPYYDEITKAYKGAKNTNPVLSRMQTLLNKGDLPTPLFYGLANKVGGAFGLNIGALVNADAQEFEKLSVEFLKNAKDIFGSRLTNYDVQTFLKSIPSLSQSDEGKQRIINNLQTVNQGALLKQQALKDIIAANGGKRPYNLSELVEERVEPQLDQLGEDFAQGTPLGKSASRTEQSAQNINPGVQFEKNEHQLPNNRASETPLEQIPLTGTQLSRGKEPSGISEAGRFVKRTGARIAEGLAGRVTAIPSLALRGINSLGENTIGRGIPFHNDIQDVLNPRKATEALSGESLNPRNETEKRIDEVASDFGAFLGNPAQGLLKMVGGAAAKAGLGNLASYLTKSVGGSEGAQTGAKIATTILGTLFGGRKDLNNQYKEGYKTSESLAKGQSTNASSLKEGVSKISQELKKGIETPEREYLLPKIKEITSKIVNGKIPVDEAVKIKQNLNSYLRKGNAPYEAKPFIKKLVELIKSGPISEFSKKNPEFGKAFNKAENIYKGLNKTSKITNFLQKHVNVEKISNPLIKTLLVGGLYKAGGIPLAAAGTGTAFGAREVSRILDLLKNSSEARKYYLNAIKSASIENSGALNRYVNKLDKLATEEGY